MPSLPVLADRADAAQAMGHSIAWRSLAPTFVVLAGLTLIATVLAIEPVRPQFANI
jgi:hypothetical protein